MTYKVEFSPDAIADLDEIWDYIAGTLGNRGAAANTVKTVLDKTDLLASQPETGARLLFDNNLDSGYRYLVCGNYLAFYRVIPGTVYVDRVIYGKRDYMRILFG